MSSVQMGPEEQRRKPPAETTPALGLREAGIDQ
jgi:hypothetical protein